MKLHWYPFAQEVYNFKASQKYIAKQFKLSATSCTISNTPGKQETSAVKSITGNCPMVSNESECFQIIIIIIKKTFHKQNQTCIYKVYMYCTSAIPKGLNCIGKNQKQCAIF